MDPMSNITRAMNDITLEEEEDGGLAVDGLESTEHIEPFTGFNAKVCLVGKFIAEGPLDFPTMQQTLAALWKPGKGVYIKELEENLFIFQFYHEIDIKRVIDGSPWSFNRKALIIARMQEGENPHCVLLNTIDLWVQVHDLKPGFMSEAILKEVGKYIGGFVESCSRNFVGGWKEYLRVRVKVDLSKPIKRCMKIRKAGNEWDWINFKYENVPTFCFICGVIGHSDKFCARLFDTPENEIVKPYGSWMRAPLRRQTKLIGEKWLRNGVEEIGRNSSTVSSASRSTVQINSYNYGEKSVPEYQQNNKEGENHGVKIFQNAADGAGVSIPNQSGK